MIYALYAKLWVLVIRHLFYWHTGVQLYNFWHKKRQVRIERNNLHKKVQTLSFVLPKIKSNGFCSKKINSLMEKILFESSMPFCISVSQMQNLSLYFCLYVYFFFFSLFPVFFVCKICHFFTLHLHLFLFLFRLQLFFFLSFLVWQLFTNGS